MKLIRCQTLYTQIGGFCHRPWDGRAKPTDTKKTLKTVGDSEKSQVTITYTDLLNIPEFSGRKLISLVKSHFWKNVHYGLATYIAIYISVGAREFSGRKHIFCEEVEFTGGSLSV